MKTHIKEDNNCGNVVETVRTYLLRDISLSQFNIISVKIVLSASSRCGAILSYPCHNTVVLREVLLVLF